MRALKFRAWDIDKKIYGEVALLEWFSDVNSQERNFGHKGRASLWNHANEADSGSWGRWIELVELEQFTGLKDSNGREIFEGDIVDAKNHFPRYYRIDFVDGGFCASWINGEGYPLDIAHFFDSTGCSISVVGNVHETPELQMNTVALESAIPSAYH